jgi:hypothetical protein
MILLLIWWFTSTDHDWLSVCIPIDALLWFIFYNIPFKLWLGGPPEALAAEFWLESFQVGLVCQGTE